MENMSDVAIGTRAPELARTRTAGAIAKFEDALLSFVLLGMVSIPIVEIVLRRLGSTGISGSTAFVQHGTLLVGMIGAMMAARERRLLALATASFLPGRWRLIAGVLAAAFGAAVAIYLAIAGLLFVLTEREAGGTLAYGIPLWIVQLVLPIGFAIIALRLLLHAAEGVGMRLVTAGLATLMVVTPYLLGESTAGITFAALAALIAAAILGMPIFAILGGAALILNWAAEIPIAVLAVSHYTLVVNPSLPAIPLFTLAGYLLAEGRASERLVRLFTSLFGTLRGGPAVVTVLACTFFTAFTGGSGITILALGGLLYPILRSARYSERDSLGLLTGAGSLGLLFPPCLPLILYAIVAEVKLEQMFLGGIVPGLLLVGLTSAWGVWRQPAAGSAGQQRAIVWREALTAVRGAKWELLLPVVVMVALFGGFATPVEAAALTALYALVVVTLVHRDYESFGSVIRVFGQCGLLVGGILLILGVALGFTNYLTDAQIASMAMEWVTSSIESKLLFLLLLNLFLIVVGCLMDVYSAIVVVVPLIVPIGMAFEIDPVHLGIIFLANLELGYLTPPVGMNLFISSYRFNKPLLEVYRATLPMLVVLLVGVLTITYIPVLTTFLPRLIGR
jgi:C4-dicarboxylate transporter, DctM subunit